MGAPGRAGEEGLEDVGRDAADVALVGVGLVVVAAQRTELALPPQGAGGEHPAT